MIETTFYVVRFTFYVPESFRGWVVVLNVGRMTYNVKRYFERLRPPPTVITSPVM